MPHIKPKAESKNIITGIIIEIAIVFLYLLSLKYINASTLSASVPENPCNKCLEVCK